MEQAQARPVDDEGLPRPPPVHGTVPRLLVKIMVKVETVTFMAVAIALLVIAVVAFARLNRA